MIWIILYAVSAFVIWAIWCGISEKEANRFNRIYRRTVAKPKYFTMFLFSLIWPVYLVFVAIKKLAGGN